MILIRKAHYADAWRWILCKTKAHSPPIINDSMHHNKDNGLYAAVHDHNFHK